MHESRTTRTPNPSPSLKLLRRFVGWLDNRFTVPGTRMRVGLDPIVGLVPGAGDAIGALLSAWILIEAARTGASAATLGRMGLNVAIDAVTGAIPVLGDVFDFVWMANRRNLALLEDHLADPQRRARSDWRFVFLVLAALVLLAFGVVAGVVSLVKWLRVMRMDML